MSSLSFIEGIRPDMSHMQSRRPKNSPSLTPTMVSTLHTAVNHIMPAQAS